eukprot:scaffold76713_cov17-Tisochrysis_lutea.AAC.1
MSEVLSKQSRKMENSCFVNAPLLPCALWHLQVFLDVNLEGKPLGRIVIELFTDVNVGSSRFRDLAVGKEGGYLPLNSIRSNSHDPHCDEGMRYCALLVTLQNIAKGDG